jgi:hypothetical protein
VCRLCPNAQPQRKGDAAEFLTWRAKNRVLSPCFTETVTKLYWSKIMGRPRIHASGADKQRAYRQRIKLRDAEIRKGLPIVTNRTATCRLPPIPAAYPMYESAIYYGTTEAEALRFVLEQWEER